MYNWQQPDWPNFIYDINSLAEYTRQYEDNLIYLSGSLSNLTDAEKSDLLLQLMINEAVKTSHIEGEFVSRADVMSSVKHHMGLDQHDQPSHDLRAVGVTAMMNALCNSFSAPLSQQMLFDWHKHLLNYASYNASLEVGGWRTHQEAMQVVSGRVGKVVVHFEAPPSHAVPDQMANYIAWFNLTAKNQENEIPSAAIRAGVSHIYFESIHPFADGNGRIGRALAEKVLSQSYGQPIPISISSCIEPKKKNYYAALKQAQTSNDITAWLHYFGGVLIEAQESTKTLIQFILKKARFFDSHPDELNQRQIKVIRRMFEAGPSGFEGGMSAKKYMTITRCSKATASRDLASLLQKKMLYQLEGSGRNTRYDLNI
ncbi:MAG: Fic family protein [Coxiellaceae bacterium]|nr:Fic family protein [Coxiellaceae bacterium]